jgi:peptidoglycan-associated lipoprotein
MNRFVGGIFRVSKRDALRAQTGVVEKTLMLDQEVVVTMIRRTKNSGLALVLLFAVILFLGACSSKQSRVESSGVTTGPGTQKATSEEEEARQRAEAERLAQSRAAEGSAAQGAQKTMEEVQAFESEPIYFEFDRSDISAQYRPVLEKKAAWLKAHPEYRLRLEGHCDERGTAEYNVALGEKRAMSVKDYLVALGVPAKRISTISYGEERPAVRGNDESAWVKNRRVEFRLLT